MNIFYKFKATGRVQGVGFRRFVQTTAQAFGVTGWVKNNADGSVSVAAYAPEKSIDLFVKKIEAGSFFSRVDSIEPIDRHQHDAGDSPEKFVIKV